MASDYTTRALVKAALEIDSGSSSADDLIDAKITAASRSIDRYCNRRFYLDATVSARVINPKGRTWADNDGEHLMVADIGTDTGLIVETGRGSDWTAITANIETEPTDALELDPAEPITSLLYMSRYFVTRSNGRVRVTARWGWPAVPDVVGEAALIQATRLYKRKDSPEGVLGSAEWGGAIRMSRVDPDVAAMLEKLVLPGLG